MRLAYACILIAALQPFLATGLAKFGGQRSGVRYNNHAPRNTLSRLSGWPLRAHWAQQNGFEAFPFFAAAVLMAVQAGVEPGAVDLWALTFVLARFAYLACYLADWATLRSLVWLAGIAACVRLAWAAVVA